MNPTPTASVIAQAAGHLHAAAELADEQAPDDLLSPWPPFAGHIRLIAAGLTGDPDPVPADRDALDGITTHLNAAAAALDTVPAGQGPSDVCLWVWHVGDLANQLKRLRP